MKLPEIRKQLGKEEKNIKVYIEDYVWNYLKSFQDISSDCSLNSDAKIVLFGEKYKNELEQTYLIYGAMDFEFRNDQEKETEDIFGKYQPIGCLNMELWKRDKSNCEGILIGDSNGGQPIEGINIFYETNEAMEDYLSTCYEKKRHVFYKSEKPQNENKEKDDNNEEMPSFPFLFSLIRMVVICIFIVFCAIAVMAVNSYGKINDFVDTAVEVQQSAF